MIVLEGQGDTEVKIIDKEIWDWIMNEDNGRGNSTKSGWNDQVCPLSIRTKLWEIAKNNKYHVDEEVTEKPEDFPVFVTIGSWQNDRAITAPAVIINKEALFGSILDVMKWCQKNNIIPLKEYHGYIY